MPNSTVGGIDLWHWYQTARQQARAVDATLAAELEIELDGLLLDVTDLDRLALRLQTFKQRQQIPLALSLTDLTHLWQQRLHQRIPIQYLVGRVHWRHFHLRVAPGVLIPRPETELIIDLAVASTQENTAPEFLAQGHWVDLGTGSGAIALGLATVFPNATIHAVDQSETALTIARENAQALNLSDHIHFYQGTWLQPLDVLKGQLSGIVSNPPYIPTAAIEHLQPEVAWHEPRSALDGGPDGLDAIRQIIATAPDYLRSGGILLFEMMAGQDRQVQNLLLQEGHYRNIQIHKDLAGIHRFAQAYKTLGDNRRIRRKP